VRERHSLSTHLRAAIFAATQPQQSILFAFQLVYLSADSLSTVYQLFSLSKAIWNHWCKLQGGTHSCEAIKLITGSVLGSKSW
jgi:hypothetical protein